MGLILSRNEGSKVMIGDDIIVTVLRIDRHQVKLHFDAPQDVNIHRDEVWHRIQAENKAKNNR